MFNIQYVRMKKMASRMIRIEMPNGASDTSWKGPGALRGKIPLTEKLLRCGCARARRGRRMPDIELFGYDKKTEQKKTYT